ncbi:MFS transporter [Ktedonosporobacter rubrisoli]|nr:MFS transporter [Ktedonosporobacter rubrisoli]
MKLTENHAWDEHIPTLQRARSWVLLGAALATLMSSMDTSIVNVGLPVMVSSLHTTFASMQWVVLSYMLVVTSCIVGVGRLGDLFGKKGLYLAGLLLFTLASLGCGLMSRVEGLIALRALQGLGAAVMMALSFALVSDVFPKERVGRAVGLLSGTVAFGIALGPALGGMLIGSVGWPAIFLVNVPFGVVAWIVIWRFLPGSSPGKMGTRFDWGGTLVLASLLACYALAMTEAETYGFNSLVVPGLLLAALCGLGLLFLIERRVKAPLLPVALFRNALLSGSLIMSVLVYTVMMCTILLLPFFLEKVEHLPAQAIDILMAVGPLITATFSVPAGWLADRLGTRIVMILGLLCMVLGCLYMATITLEADIVGFVARIAVINFGLALFQTPNNTTVMEVAQATQRGLASGLLSLARTLGLSTGASLMGAVFAALVMQAAGAVPDINAAPAIAFARGIQGTFSLASIFIVAALVLAIVIWLYLGRREAMGAEESSDFSKTDR